MYEVVKDYSGRQVVGFCMKCDEIWDCTKGTFFFLQQLNCPAAAVKQITTVV